MSTISRAHCSVSGLPLFARVDGDGQVTGVSNVGVSDDERPESATWRDVDLFDVGGADDFDPVTQVRSDPTYAGGFDRVIRRYTVRDKTAAELLREISYWSAALNRPHDFGGTI